MDSFTFYFRFKSFTIQYFGIATNGAVINIFGFERHHRHKKQADKLLVFLQNPLRIIVATRTIFYLQRLVLFGFGLNPCDENHGIKIMKVYNKKTGRFTQRYCVFPVKSEKTGHFFPIKSQPECIFGTNFSDKLRKM